MHRSRVKRRGLARPGDGEMAAFSSQQQSDRWKSQYHHARLRNDGTADGKEDAVQTIVARICGIVHSEFNAGGIGGEVRQKKDRRGPLDILSVIGGIAPGS